MVANTASVPTDRPRPTSLAGVLIVFTSIAVSIASYGLLAETVRIRWTIGSYQQYGPEHAPALAVLVTFPVVIAGLYVGAQLLRNHIERSGRLTEFDTFRVIYDSYVLLVLGVLLGSQLVVVGLNL